MNTIWTGPISALARLLMAFIFIGAGMGKIADPGALAAEITKIGVPFAPLDVWIAVIIELGGGLLILAGYLTRPVAVGMAVWCLFTGFLVHFVPGDLNMMIHLMKNICMAGGFLQLAAWGAGSWSVDARLQGRPSVLQAAE